MHQLITNSRRYRSDLAICVVLWLAALAVRWPYLYLIPRFTDEVNETWLSLRMIEGQSGPFTSIIAYMGPVYSQLMALIFTVWMDPWIPRGLIAVLASLTIPATYGLGRMLYGRAGGLIAAALVMTSSAHIVVSSHTSIANSLTPLFAVLCLACLILARRRDSAWFLGMAGVALALAAQTHPLAFTLAPGLGLWFLSTRPSWAWLRRPGLYAAGAAAVLTYSPVLVPAVLDPRGFYTALNSRAYAYTTDHSLSTYLANVQNFGVEMVRMLGAIFQNYQLPRQYLFQPLSLAYAILTPPALLYGLRTAGPLVWGLASAVLLIPFFNHQYGDYPYFARYLTFLLPVVLTLVAGLCVALFNWIKPRIQARAGQVLLVGGGLAAVVVLVVAPLSPLFDYYENQMQSGRSNALLLDIVERVAAEPGSQVYLDSSLFAGEFPNGGNLFYSFQIWFSLARRPAQVVDLKASVGRGACRLGGFLIAADDVTARLGNCAVSVVGAQIPTRPGREDLSYSLYRLEPQ